MLVLIINAIDRTKNEMIIIIVIIVIIVIITTIVIINWKRPHNFFQKNL